MDFSVAIAVLFAAALHAAWNTAIHSNTDKLTGTALVCFGATIVGLPQLAFLPPPQSESYAYIVASGFVHGIYFTVLWLAYKNSSFSIAYPIARGSVPLLTTIGAVIWLSEVLDIYSLVGIVVISAAIIWLSIDGISKGGVMWNGIVYALLNAVVIASYSLIDGAGVRLAGNAMSYNIWVSIANSAFFLPVVICVQGRDFAPRVVAGWKFGLLAGTMGLAGYGIVIWAMSHAPIGMVSALRETSVVFGALFAARILKEKLGIYRLVACAMLVVGVVIMRMA